MAYNPGISYRGEMLGQAIGQAGQGIAQAYGTGLQLKEEQKRYDDMMKQRRRDRKNLKKSYATQAELLGVDKDDVETMGLGELQGFVEGTRMKQSFDFQALQLKQLEDNIAQTGAGKKALGQMQMYISEQNLDPIEAATMAATDHGLELGEASKLVSYATTGQKLGLELQTIQARKRGLDLQERNLGIAERTAGVQERQVSVQEGDQEERKNPKPPTSQDVEGAPGYKVIDMGGGRRQLVAPVDDGDQDVNSLSVEGRKVTSQVDEILGHMENIEEGDDRYGLGFVFSRQGKSTELVKTIAKNNRTYKAKYGDNHPDYIRLMRRVAPFIQANKDSDDETNQKLAKQLAKELGIKID